MAEKFLCETLDSDSELDFLKKEMKALFQKPVAETFQLKKLKSTLFI